MYQVGRTLFCFKLYDPSSELLPSQTPPSIFPNSMKINPEHHSLAYSVYKGTAYKRKLMLKNVVEYIPREFGSGALVADDLAFSRLETILGCGNEHD